MSATALLAALIVAFAASATTHVAIAFGLASRIPRWRAIVAFVVFPLAPYFALRERMRARAAAWTFFVLAYVALRMFA